MSDNGDSRIISKTRIETFSDNVFSIVLTLLVFSFKLPHLKGDNDNQELYEHLLGMHHYFTSYVMTFALIGMFWVAHHKLFQEIKRSDNILLWLNMLFLLCLSFLPFPAEVLGAFPDAESGAVFFGIAMIAASLAFSGMRYYCYFLGRLVDGTMSDERLHRSMARAIIGIALYAVAILVSAYSEDITLSMYVLIPFLYFLYTPKMRSKKL